VFWLIIFFFCFGLISENNATVITIMLVCTLSVCGAIFLILEMSHPFYGVIKVSSAPLQKALEILSK
jgi:membrane-bound ClpP family serine protease